MCNHIQPSGFALCSMVTRAVWNSMHSCNYICWPLPSNQSCSFFVGKLHAYYQRGVGDHRVGNDERVMGQQNSCKTLSGCIRPCISCTPIKILQLTYKALGLSPHDVGTGGCILMDINILYSPSLGAC